MLKSIFVVSLLVSLAVAKTCIPAQTTFYWQSPCSGQNFSNLITVTDLIATQNGISVDTNGGLDMEVPIDLVMTGSNNYGILTTPLVNIDVYQYSGLRDCSWSKQPTFDKLQNIDGCEIITSDCHMTDLTATTTTASIDLKKLLGEAMLAATVVGDYYALAVTTFDGKKPLQCVWSQDIVIKK